MALSFLPAWAVGVRATIYRLHAMCGCCGAILTIAVRGSVGVFGLPVGVGKIHPSPAIVELVGFHAIDLKEERDLIVNIFFGLLRS